MEAKLKVYQLFLLVAVGLIACDKDINKEARPSTTIERAEAQLGETKQERVKRLVTDGFADMLHDTVVPFVEAEKLRPVGRESLDLLWSMISQGHKSKALRLLGFLGQSSDLDQLIKRIKDRKRDNSEFAVGIFATRQDLEPRVAEKALSFLLDCSKPIRQQEVQGEGTPSKRIYSSALGCVFGLAVVRSNKAIQHLQMLSETDHSNVMTSGDSKRFRVEVLASIYRLNRLEAYGGTIGYALEKSRKNDPLLKAAFADLGKAAEALGYSGAEIMDEK